MRTGWGTTLKNRRRELKLTQGDIATACGVSTASISYYEREEVVPGIDIIEPWAAVLDWSVASFLRAFGITLSPVGAERLPTTLVQLLLELEGNDRALAAVKETALGQLAIQSQTGEREGL